MAKKNQPAPLATFVTESKASKPAASAPDASDEKLRQKVFRLTPAQDRKLKEYCAHSDMSIQDVVMHGLNLVMKERGLPSLSDIHE